MCSHIRTGYPDRHALSRVDIQATDKLASSVNRPTMNPACLYGFTSRSEALHTAHMPGSWPQPAAQPSDSTINGAIRPFEVMAVQAAQPAGVLEQGETLEDKVDAENCSKDFETPSMNRDCNDEVEVRCMKRTFMLNSI